MANRAKFFPVPGECYESWWQRMNPTPPYKRNGWRYRFSPIVYRWESDVLFIARDCPPVRF